MSSKDERRPLNKDGQTAVLKHAITIQKKHERSEAILHLSEKSMTGIADLGPKSGGKGEKGNKGGNTGGEKNGGRNE